MTMLNTPKFSFQFSAFSNINVADAYNYNTLTILLQQSPAPFIISSTILYNNVAWKNMQHFSGQYFG